MPRAAVDAHVVASVGEVWNSTVAISLVTTNEEAARQE
jgi:hypothetical protein